MGSNYNVHLIHLPVWLESAHSRSKNRGFGGFVPK